MWLYVDVSEVLSRFISVEGRVQVSNAGAYNFRNVMCIFTLVVKVHFLFVFFLSRSI